MNRAILVVLTDSEKTGTQMKDIKTNYSDYFFFGGGVHTPKRECCIPKKRLGDELSNKK